MNAALRNPPGQHVFDPSDPMPTAHVILKNVFTDRDNRTLHHYSGQFFLWRNGHYPAADEQAIRSTVYKFLSKSLRPVSGRTAPFQPTTTKVNNVLDALKAVTNLNAQKVAPAWLGEGAGFPAEDVISLRNGLLYLPGRRQLEPTPAFWTHNALSYNYDQDALDPENWLRFLGDIWPDDPESINTLQEIFGYLLTADTRQQKAFLLVGPKRSGKGTIARVATAMLGQDNVCAPTLASLSSQFGLAPLINKLVAIIADARLGARADQQQIAERLLSVSGEDGQTLDRKYLPPWTGRLPTRFVIMSNELPRLADASGALASRFIVLRMTNSFYGREDQGLTDRLLDELPSILLWALDGRDRLMKRGHFSQPKSAHQAIQEFEDLSSPIGAFIRDCCEISPMSSASVDDVFRAWKGWCDDQGRDHPGTKQTFGRDLRAAIPTLDTQQVRESGKRGRRYQGICLQL